MFKQIVSYINIKEAYLEIVEQFAADRRAFKYHGLDNTYLRDLDLKSHKLIKEIKQELLDNSEIEPALSVKIAKKNKPGEFREIFVYNIKERVKAQAIYRVVLLEFEKRFSNRLFSYRPNKPPYLAARIFCRRYRAGFLTDSVLVLDLKNYSDKINRELMFLKIKQLGFDDKVNSLLKLFIFNKVYRDGSIALPTVGLIQGVPLIALFVNFYLTDFDLKYQKEVDFYLRVGDDIVFIDDNLEKIKKISKIVTSDLDFLNLEINQTKLFLGATRESFSYLGYHFNNGLIALDKGFILKNQLEWKEILKYKNLPFSDKKNLFKKMMYQDDQNFNFKFKKIIKDKSQINDTGQIKKISESFFKIMTIFFYQRYSFRNRRLLKGLLKDYKLTSLYQVYQKFHYEKHP
jgi:hypothetical protein